MGRNDWRSFAVLRPLSPSEIVQLLSLGFVGVYEHESLSLRESRPVRAGEGLRGWPALSNLGARKTLPGRYRSRPSRQREGVGTLFKQTTSKLRDLGDRAVIEFYFVAVLRPSTLSLRESRAVRPGEGNSLCEEFAFVHSQ